jgi:hypothetical protein
MGDGRRADGGRWRDVDDEDGPTTPLSLSFSIHPSSPRPETQTNNNNTAPCHAARLNDLFKGIGGGASLPAAAATAPKQQLPPATAAEVAADARGTLSSLWRLARKRIDAGEAAAAGWQQAADRLRLSSPQAAQGIVGALSRGGAAQVAGQAALPALATLAASKLPGVLLGAGKSNTTYAQLTVEQRESVEEAVDAKLLETQQQQQQVKQQEEEQAAGGRSSNGAASPLLTADADAVASWADADDLLAGLLPKTNTTTTQNPAARYNEAVANQRAVATATKVDDAGTGGGAASVDLTASAVAPAAGRKGASATAAGGAKTPSGSATAKVGAEAKASGGAPVDATAKGAASSGDQDAAAMTASTAENGVGSASSDAESVSRAAKAGAKAVSASTARTAVGSSTSKLQGKAQAGATGDALAGGASRAFSELAGTAKAQGGGDAEAKDGDASAQSLVAAGTGAGRAEADTVLRSKTLSGQSASSVGGSVAVSQQLGSASSSLEADAQSGAGRSVVRIRGGAGSSSVALARLRERHHERLLGIGSFRRGGVAMRTTTAAAVKADNNNP